MIKYWGFFFISLCSHFRYVLSCWLKTGISREAKKIPDYEYGCFNVPSSVDILAHEMRRERSAYAFDGGDEISIKYQILGGKKTNKKNLQSNLYHVSTPQA